MGIDKEILRSKVFNDILSSVSKLEDETHIPLLPHKKIEINWNLALFLCSALEDHQTPESVIAIIRICFAAILNEETSGTQKKSALLLLERIGNWPSINLATEKDSSLDNYQNESPCKLKAESLLIKEYFTIRLAGEKTLLGNQFQREFWESIGEDKGLSISAPTTAGKSFITMQWISEKIKQPNIKEILYIVPSRALIDEVSNKLLADKSINQIPIIIYPWDEIIDIADKKICVMTQERALIYLNLHKNSTDILFIDEAQKIEDSTRGTLLETLIKFVLSNNKSVDIVFSSPSIKNPDMFVERFLNGGSPSITNELPNVLQNIYLISPVYRKPNKILIQRQSQHKNLYIVDEISLPKKLDKKNKFTTLTGICTQLFGFNKQNIIYADTPANAEKIADYLYSKLPEYPGSNPKINELFTSVVNESVHNQYSLSKLISKGIAYHYGPMPQNLRSLIEKLYSEGYIKYLVCTSTLLEGVNLPCTNLWLPSMKKSKENIFNSTDFWNLAGRAGRWGKEFSGNIFCVDINNNEIPEKKLNTIIPASDRFALSVEDANLIFENPDTTENSNDYLLAHAYQMKLTSQNIDFVNQFDETNKNIFNNNLVNLQFDVPPNIFMKHSSINPIRINNLFNYMRDLEKLPKLLHPYNRNFLDDLLPILEICSNILGANYSDERFRFKIAILLRSWAKGVPTPQIINEQIKYFSKIGSNKNKESIIRETLSNINKYCRFEAPKYLSLYQDVLRLVLPAGELVEFDSYEVFELGVSDSNQINLMKIGFSRQSAINLSTKISNQLNNYQLLTYIKDTDADHLSESISTIEEINNFKDNQLDRRLKIYRDIYASEL